MTGGQRPAGESEESGDISAVGSPGMSGAAVEPELDEVLVAGGLWRYGRRGGCLYEGVHVRFMIIGADVARKYSYTSCRMDVSVAEAKNRLPELIRAMEDGEEIIITRHGRPVAQIAPAPSARRTIRWGALRDRIKLLPGWDDPMTEEELLGERI